METPTTPRSTLNPPVFYTSAALILALVLFTVLLQEEAQSLFNHVQQWIITNASWFYVLAVALILISVVFLAVSRYGDIKLGPDHSRPDYRNTTWFAMLFSAGMGIGLMFFGVAEPVMHFTTPPVGEPNTVQAAKEAMKLTFFHWGLHAWAIYAIVALILAFFSYRHGLPLTLRSALYPLIGERIYGPIGHAVDIFAIIGTVFGVATSLGYGVLQINSGLHHLFGWPVNQTVQIALIAATCGLATLSVASGLDRGIRILSELNLSLAVILLLFVLVLGPTVFLLQTYVQNTGAYLSDIVNKTFNLYAYEPTDWIGGWTLLYWGWWLSWSPFVGLFIARISRGRTIREFVCGVLFVPVGFTLAVDDGVRRYRHPHGPAGGLHPVGRSGQPGQFGGAVRLPRALPAGQRDFAGGGADGGGVLRHLGRLRRAGGGHAGLQRQGPLAALAADILVGADGRGGHRPAPRRWPQGAANRDHRHSPSCSWRRSGACSRRCTWMPPSAASATRR